VGEPNVDADVMSHILKGDGFARQCLYQVPIGKSVIIMEVSLSCPDDGHGVLYTRLPGGVPYRLVHLYGSGDSGISTYIPIPPAGTIDFFGTTTALFPEGAFIYMQVQNLEGGSEELFTNMQVVVVDTRELGL